MNSESGKTFRYVDGGKKKDSSIMIGTNNRNEDSIVISGYEFFLGLPYSVKKKQRWQLLSMVSNKSYEGEVPIVYSKHQCVYKELPILDLYLYDSISNTTIGSSDVSNRQLNKGHFNLKSTLCEITNKDDKSHEKSTRKKISKNRKLHAKNCSVHEMKESLSPSEENKCNKEKRKDCVSFSEYVQINDLSRVNIVKPYRYRYWPTNDRKTDDFYHLLENNDDFDYNDEESDEETVYTEVISKPFIINTEDLISQKNENYVKRKRQKKKSSFIQHCFVNEQKSTEIESDFIIKEYEDVLSYIVIDLSRDQFLNELKSISEFCKCWHCDVSPLIILLDLDEFNETREKSFVILRPSVQRSESEISVKIFLNLSNGDLVKNDICDTKFNSLITLVTFVQSRLRSSNDEKLSILSKVVTFDGSVDELTNLPTVKRVDTEQYLYLYHNEWKNCGFYNINLENIMDLNMNLMYSMNECNVCESIIPDDVTIIVKQCQHRVCESCLSQHIIERLDAHIEDMNCPCRGCVVQLDAPTMLSLVSWQHYRLRLDVLESAVLARCGQPCHQCASVLMTNDCFAGNSKSIEYVCTCGKCICNSCGQLRHWPSSCQEMKEHSMKVVKLLHEDIGSFDSKPILCTNCISKSRKCALKTFLKFKCTNLCCKLYRPLDKRYVSKCEQYKQVLQLSHVPRVMISLQESKSPTIKFFNQSVHFGLLLRKENFEKFQNEFLRISVSKMVTQSTSYSVEDSTRLYTQTLRVLESMYVSAYNNCKKYNPQRLQQLKVAADHLMFYAGRIRALVDDIGCLVKQRRGMGGTDLIRHKYASLERHIEDAHRYSTKTVHLRDFN